MAKIKYRSKIGALGLCVNVPRVIKLNMAMGANCGILRCQAPAIPHSFKQMCAEAQKTGQSCFQNEAFCAQVCVNHHPSGVDST